MISFHFTWFLDLFLKDKNDKQKKTPHINVEALRERQAAMKYKGKNKGGRIIPITTEQTHKQIETEETKEEEEEESDEQVRRKTGALIEADEGNTISKVDLAAVLKHPSALISCSADKSISSTKLTENGIVDKNSITVIDSCDTAVKAICANDKYIVYGTKDNNLNCYNRELKKSTQIALVLLSVIFHFYLFTFSFSFK